MINLNHSDSIITSFVKSSIRRFEEEFQTPNSIGIYCCPWSGWLTTNYNLNKKLEETDNNCPDFEYVEFDLLELSKWREEYEKERPEFILNNLIKTIGDNHGDQNFNDFIFEYLKPLLSDIKEIHKCPLLLQMLDSTISELV